MTSRIAQTLRGLSLRPSLESDVDASTVTGDGDQTAVVAVEEAQAEPADGAAAPGEDQEVTAVVVEVAEGTETESAETEATDSEVVASTESDTTEGEEAAAPAAEEAAAPAAEETNNEEAAAPAEATPAAEVGETDVDASLVTGDGEQAAAVEIEAADETPADGAAAPGEDQEVTATIVEVAEGAETETAETEVADSELTVSTEALPAVLLAWGIGAAAATALSAYLGHRLDKSGKEIEELKEKVDNKKALIEKLEYDLRRKGAEAKARAEKEGISLESLEVSQEGVGGAVVGGVYAGLFGLVSYGFGSYFAAGLFGAAELAALSEIKKLKKELAALEDQLSEKELALVKEIAAAERKGVVSQESDAGVAAIMQVESVEAEANAAAAAAAAHVAEGAAAAAEAAAAAAAAVTGEDQAADAADAAAEAGDVTEEAAVEAEEAVAEGAEIDSAEEAKAIEDGHAEIEAAAQDIEDGEAHAEEYEQAAATLESLVDALRDAQKTGGLTPQSAQFFNISFESIGVRLTGKPFQNAHGEACIPSMESFGGTMRRDDATRISMEAAGDWLKKIWEVLKKTFAQIKAWVIKFVQAVFDQAERFDQRATKIIEKAKAAKGNAKSDTVELGRAGIKIARNGKVDIADLADLVMLAEEATVRSVEGSKVITAIRAHMNAVVAELAKADVNSVDLDTLIAARLGIAAAATSGDLKSAAFSEPYEDGFAKGFQTELLPGNVRLATIHPGSEGSFGNVLALLRGWRVITIQGEEQEVGAQPTLDLGQIVTVSENVKKALAAAKKAKDSLKTEQLDLGSITVADAPEENAKVIQKFVSTTAKSVSHASSSIGALLKYVVGTSGYYLDYAAASLKQYGAEAPAAAEAAAA